MKTIVLDTNVLVSGLLSPYGPPGRILDAIVAGGLTLVFDDRILGEYEDVLTRQEFGFDPQHIRALLRFFETEGRRVAARPLAISLPDRDDVMFIEVAVAGRADAIVTGNKAHFPKEGYGGIPVLSPAECLERLTQPE